MSATDLLDTAAAARYLGLTFNTLTIYRGTGRGPKFVKDGHRVLYRKADLDSYLADVEAATTAFARRSVRMTAALAEITDADLDGQLFQLMRAEAAARKADRPAMADLYQAMINWLLAEYARRNRKPTYTKPARKPAPATREHSPYL